MSEHGFTELQTIEILLREYEVDCSQHRPCAPAAPHTLPPFSAESISS